MYYGFSVLLLFVTAPLWVAGPLAAVSWWGLMASKDIERDIRTPLADFRL